MQGEDTRSCVWRSLRIQRGDRDTGDRVLLLMIQSGDKDMGISGVVRVMLRLIQNGEMDMGPRGEVKGWAVRLFLLLLHNMGHHPSYNPLDLIKIHKTWEQEGQTFYAEDLANEDK